MSSTFPEDVYAEIAKAISALPKGATGEERDSLRRLRDSTLLNLSLTSTEISSVSLSFLRRNITLRFLKTLTFLLHTKHLASPFINTRSLILDFSQRKDEQEDLVAQQRKDSALHDELGPAHEALEPIAKERARVLDVFRSLPESAPLKPWGSKLNDLSKNQDISAVSAVLECMPNLQYLQMIKGGFIQFVRLTVRKGTDIHFSRPLLGLSNLKILRIDFSLNSALNPSNSIWLMVFLENLTHFQAITLFKFQDKRFLLEHEEVLKGKSKITHLDLSFGMIQDKEWPTSFGVDIQSLELFLQVTKGLKELKIHNTRPPSKIPLTPSITFLRAIRSSFKTLKYLSLEGEFPHQISRDPVPIHLHSLELLSVSSLHISALSFLVDFKAPSLKSIAFAGESKGIEQINGTSEWRAVGWIENKDFPATVKTVFVDGEPNFKEGSSQAQSLWKNFRGKLIERCQKKNIEVKLLKAGDQLPFGVMPEPEDLL